MGRVEYKDIEEYKEKHEFLLIAVISVLIFTLLTILGLYTWDVIKYNPNKSDNSLFNQQPLATVAGVELLIFFVFIITYFLGTIKSNNRFFDFIGINYSLSQGSALSFLVISTLLFIAIITIPIIFFGGAQNSWHGSLLVSMSALIVLVSDSRYIRSVFFILCLSIYSITSFFYINIEIISYNWYRSFNIGAILVITFISYRLTKKFPTIMDAYKKTPEQNSN